MSPDQRCERRARVVRFAQARFVTALNEGIPPKAPTQHPALPDKWTPGEAEVPALIGQGLSKQEIGVRLFLGRATVKTHINRVFAKTGLRDRALAVRYAIANDLGGDPEMFHQAYPQDPDRVRQLVVGALLERRELYADQRYFEVGRKPLCEGACVAQPEAGTAEVWIEPLRVSAFGASVSSAQTEASQEATIQGQTVDFASVTVADSRSRPPVPRRPIGREPGRNLRSCCTHWSWSSTVGTRSSTWPRRSISSRVAAVPAIVLPAPVTASITARPPASSLALARSPSACQM